MYLTTGRRHFPWDDLVALDFGQVRAFGNRPKPAHSSRTNLPPQISTSIYNNDPRTMVLLSALRYPLVSRRNVRTVGTFVPIRAARITQATRPLNELSPPTIRAHPASPDEKDAGHYSYASLMKATPSRSLSKTIFKCSSDVMASASMPHSARTLNETSSPFRRSPLAVSKTRSDGGDSCGILIPAPASPALRRISACGRAAVAASSVVDHSSPRLVRAVRWRKFAFEARTVLHREPRRCIARFDPRQCSVPLTCAQSMTVPKMVHLPRRLACSGLAASIPDISDRPGRMAARGLNCLATALSCGNSHTSRITPTAHVVVILVIQFASSTATRIWCIIAMSRVLSLPAGSSAGVELAVMLLRIVFHEVLLLGPNRLQGLVFAEAPLITEQSGDAAIAYHRLSFVAATSNDVQFTPCLASLPLGSTARYVLGTGWIEQPRIFSRISAPLILRKNKQVSDALHNTDAEQHHDALLISLSGGQKEQGSGTACPGGFYDDTLCAFGLFDGQGWIGGPPNTENRLDADVEWVDIPSSDEDEVILERDVSVECLDSWFQDAAHESVSYARLNDASDDSFNEWEEDDGGALERMLQHLDRIVCRRKDVTDVHADRDVVGNRLDAQMRSVQNTTPIGMKNNGDGSARKGGSRWGYSGMRHGLRALKRRLQGKS